MYKTWVQFPPLPNHYSRLFWDANTLHFLLKLLYSLAKIHWAKKRTRLLVLCVGTLRGGRVRKSPGFLSPLQERFMQNLGKCPGHWVMKSYLYAFLVNLKFFPAQQKRSFTREDTDCFKQNSLQQRCPTPGPQARSISWCHHAAYRAPHQSVVLIQTCRAEEKHKGI